MSRFLTQLAEKIEPYIPGEQPKGQKLIKLNTNENPYPCTGRVRDAVLLEMENLRLYPDPASSDLLHTIAEYYSIKEENVFVGNGSDEVLGLCFPAFFAGKKVMFPDITYSFYPVYATLFGASVKTIPLDSTFSIVPKDYEHANCGIIIANPNAPTGKALSLTEIEKIVKDNSDQVVIIDEAYVDFGCESAVKLIELYDNLLVVQTLSKSRSLAGIRCGFAMGNKALIEGLNRIKNSFNSYPLDRLAMAAGIAAIKDEDYFQKTRNQIIMTREDTIRKLEKLGFTIIPSKANFIFMSHNQMVAKRIFELLRERGILVRYFQKDRIDNYLRVTIGTPEEMETFIGEISQICLILERI